MYCCIYRLDQSMKVIVRTCMPILESFIIDMIKLFKIWFLKLILYHLSVSKFVVSLYGNVLYHLFMLPLVLPEWLAWGQDVLVWQSCIPLLFGTYLRRLLVPILHIILHPFHSTLMHHLLLILHVLLELLHRYVSQAIWWLFAAVSNLLCFLCSCCCFFGKLTDKCWYNHKYSLSLISVLVIYEMFLVS